MHDATALAASIAAGHLTAKAAMAASLDAAKRSQHLGALARVEPQLGLARADASDARYASQRGPFEGVPFLAKDLGGYGAGLAPAAGNAALRARSPDPEASDELFEAFGSAGLVSFGLTTVPEFGLALTSEPPEGPVALNPFDAALSPGGSSGGAAAAVAAGIAAIAHATDAAGSTRVPAACCGLVGLKATQGRVPGAPHFNNFLMGIASEQVVTRSVRDARAVFDAVKLDTGPAHSIERVGICLPAAASADSAAKMDEVAGALAEAGCDVARLPPIDEWGTRAQALTIPIFAASLANWLDGVGIDDAQITPINAAMAARGRAMDAPTLFANSTEMMRLSHEVAGLFEGHDALIMPVLADGPPQVGFFDPNQTDVEARLDQMNALAPNVAVANVTGLPALAVPFGMMPAPRAHLPFGFQIMGPSGSDEALFELASKIEALAPPIAFPNPIAGLSA
ncbi:MAG: amidase [Pseudomonadota bacterium]